TELKSEIYVLQQQVIDIRHKLKEQLLYKTEYESWLTNLKHQTTNFETCMAEARHMLEKKSTQTQMLKSTIEQLSHKFDVMQHEHSLEHMKDEQDKLSLRNQVEELRRQKVLLEEEKQNWAASSSSTITQSNETTTTSAFLSPIPHHLQDPDSTRTQQRGRSSRRKSPARMSDRKQLVHSVVVFVFGFLSAIMLHQSGVISRPTLVTGTASPVPSRSGSLTGSEPLYNFRSREHSRSRSVSSYMSNEIPDDDEGFIQLTLPGSFAQNNTSVSDGFFKPL
ncbi:hypothetical protein HK096_001574, partial [Nowakowskiella sp. JEL0078]